MPEAEDLQTRADRIPWFHSIDLGHGVRTRGTPYNITEEQFPDFRGRTTLDIGAWDGKYSFLAERLGATRVVALDHYAWGVDMVARGRYWTDCHDAGTLPDHSKDLTEFWRPHLPGQAGFNFAKQALGSNVEPVVADFMTTDLASLGSFDIVLYLGVLYHVKEPLTALERLRQVTNEVAVIETEALCVEGLESRPVIEFFAGDDLGRDFGNWYVPSLRALDDLCKAAGFSEMRTIVGPPVGATARHGSPHVSYQRTLSRLRTIVAQPAGSTARQQSPRASHFRALVHALV
jgi:tRNA (mo5U34)-methyltransferase